MHHPITRSFLAGSLALVTTLGAGLALAAGPTPAPTTPSAPPAASPAGDTAASRAAAPKKGPLATVNGVPVTREEFDKEVEHMPAQYRQHAGSTEGRRQILDNLILKRLLWAKAREQGLDKDAEVRAQVEAYAQQAAISALVNRAVERAGGGDIAEPELKAYYDSHADEFKTEESVRASHILVESEAEAAKLRQELVGGKDFAAVARAASKDPGSAARDGDLGFFTKERMVPEFAAAAFGLKKVGDLSPVVKTKFGYHLIKLTDRKPAGTQPFPAVKERLEAQLREQRQRAAVDTLVKEVRAKAKIEVDESRLTE